HAVGDVAGDALDGVGGVVAVRVGELIQAGHAQCIRTGIATNTLRLRTRVGLRTVYGWVPWTETVGVQRASGPEQAVARVDLVRKDLLRLVDAIAVVVDQNSRRTAAARRALRDRRSAQAVKRDDDERVGLVVGSDAYDLESRQHAERGSRRGVLILAALRG